MISLKLLPLFVSTFAAINANSYGVSWIQSPRVVGWGEWGYDERCPVGQYVKGIALKSEAYQFKGDDTALNGIYLQCIPLDKHPSAATSNKPVSSSVGPYGGILISEFCERGVAIGFETLTEPWEWDKKDATAVNDIKLTCANQRAIYRTIARAPTSFGYWTGEQRCPPKTAVCGIRTQIDRTPKSKDCSSITNVDMLCCELPNPAEICNATDEWKPIIKRDNSRGTTPMRYTLQEKVGASYSMSTSESYSVIEEISGNVGFGIGFEFLKYLGLNFEVGLGYSQNTEYHWSRTESITFSYEREESTELIIPPFCITTLYQVVGICGPYMVKANYVRRVDECPEGNKTNYYDNWFKSDGPKVQPTIFITIGTFVTTYFWLLPSLIPLLPHN